MCSEADELQLITKISALNPSKNYLDVKVVGYLKELTKMICNESSTDLRNMPNEQKRQFQKIARVYQQPQYAIKVVDTLFEFFSECPQLITGNVFLLSALKLADLCLRRYFTMNRSQESISYALLNKLKILSSICTLFLPEDITYFANNDFPFRSILMKNRHHLTNAQLQNILIKSRCTDFPDNIFLSQIDRAVINENAILNFQNDFVSVKSSKILWVKNEQFHCEEKIKCGKNVYCKDRMSLKPLSITDLNQTEINLLSDILEFDYICDFVNDISLVKNGNNKFQNKKDNNRKQQTSDMLTLIQNDRGENSVFNSSFECDQEIKVYFPDNMITSEQPQRPSCDLIQNSFSNSIQHNINCNDNERSDGLGICSSSDENELSLETIQTLGFKVFHNSTSENSSSDGSESETNEIDSPDETKDLSDSKSHIFRRFFEDLGGSDSDDEMVFLPSSIDEATCLPSSADRSPLKESEFEGYTNPCFETDESDDLNFKSSFSFFNDDITRINESWSLMMMDDNDKPKKPSRVSFASDVDLVTVHEVEYIDPATYVDTYALDHVHFRQRIDFLNTILSPYLTREHRGNVFKRNSLFQEI